MKIAPGLCSKLFIAVKGFVIGIANIIPGVSGGTIALVLNVYERMINSINNFSLHTLAALGKVLTFSRKNRDAFKKEMRKVDMLFLLLLLLGIAAAFIAFSKLMTALLENSHDIAYGFFFGLILASIIVPMREIKKYNFIVVLFLAVGIAAVVVMSVSVSDDQRIANALAEQQISASSGGTGGLTWTHGFMVFLTGILSTSAMILPGISGSFVSLLLGEYFYLLQAVAEFNLLVLGLYVAGAIIGLKLLAKVMNYLFRRFHDMLMAFLTGLVIGSLYVTWPFHNTYIVGDETLFLSNTLPSAFGTNEWLTTAAALVGILIVLGILMLNKAAQKRKPAEL